MNISRNNVFSIFLLETNKTILRNSYSATHVKHGRVFFLILIFNNHKLVNLLIVIDIFVRVFILYKYALVVFLSEIHVSFYSTPFYFIIFCSLFIKYLSKVFYLVSMYQNLSEFAKRTLFLNFNMKHMTTVIFLLFYFLSKVVHLTCSPHTFFRLSKVWSMLHHG